MAVTGFQDLPLADRDRDWDGDAADRRVRTWAGADDEPNEKYRDAHVWYDADAKDSFTGYEQLIADVVGEEPFSESPNSHCRNSENGAEMLPWR
jgi:hypothetical protein